MKGLMQGSANRSLIVEHHRCRDGPERPHLLGTHELARLAVNEGSLKIISIARNR